MVCGFRNPPPYQTSRDLLGEKGFDRRPISEVFPSLKRPETAGEISLWVQTRTPVVVNVITGMAAQGSVSGLRRV
jgi:hypothetical protein